MGKVHSERSLKDCVAIVYPWPNLDTVPSLCNAVELLAKAGYEIEVFTTDGSGFVAPSFDAESVHVTVLRSRRERRGISRLVPTRCFYPLRVLERHLRKRYRCFMGVDPEGLVRANSLSRLVRVPLVYYSLELLLSSELSHPWHKWLKNEEIPLSHKAAFVISQDEERGRLLAEENQLPFSKLVLVPNAPLGPSRRKPSRWWHQQFHLSPDQRVVLYAGSLGRWTGVEEIVASVRSWPEEWVLVVHTRSDTRSLGDMNGLRELAAEGRVFFSFKPVARQDYDLLVDGADVGIAFYLPVGGSPSTQQNVRSAGLSSGKIAYYLRSGLPVIVNDASSLGDFVQSEGCGISVRGAQGISKAITEIGREYRKYSERALEVFDNKLDFARVFGEVVRRIDSLNRGKA